MTEEGRTENRLLRQRLEDLLEQARHNERKMRRFKSWELRLIGLNSLVELIEAVVNPDRRAFDWDLVTLWLHDAEYEIQRALEEEGIDPAAHPGLIFAREREDLGALYPVSLFPLLGPYRARAHALLFPKVAKPPASVALLPLVRHGKLIGSLNIGSFAPERFAERGIRSDFLEHLAAVVAICLENAINLERIKRLGLTDTLTAVNNRRYFDQRLNEEVGHSLRSREPLSCLLIDVDHFKRINDTRGHQTGDDVLREIAALCRAQLRRSDVLSRYGGEEFAALLVHTGRDRALEVAERMRAAIETHAFGGGDGEILRVTASIGVATLNAPEDGVLAGFDSETLIARADQALYQAMSGGRNLIIRAD